MADQKSTCGCGCIPQKLNTTKTTEDKKKVKKDTKKSK